MANCADKRKFHILYKTTCLITGKWYIGIHSTDNINDGYKGSGQILSKSIKKYGNAVHTCEILEFHDTRKALGEREEELLTKEFRANPMCMNIGPGGLGLWSVGMVLTEEIKKKMSAGLKGQKRTDVTKARISVASKKTHNSPEIIARKSEMQRQAMNAPGMKEKLSLAQKIARARPEVRANLSKARMKPCTDGIHVYPSKAAFVLANGSKALNSPNFKFLPKSVL